MNGRTLPIRAYKLGCVVFLVACTTPPRKSAGAARDAEPEDPRPTLYYDFRSSDSAAFEPLHPFGAVNFGADPDAHDGYAAFLVFHGDTEGAGPSGKATEIITKSQQTFGEYRFRARLATCQPNEDLVNGFFTYFNDGVDHDGDGLVDNAEIDLEILCAQPSYINLTSWTEYTDDAHMRKKSRIVDLDTGAIYVGKTDGYGKDPRDPLNGVVDPTLYHPGWYRPGAYYEMGWDWEPARVRWFMVIGGREVTLWNFTDAARIPREPSSVRFNVWHPRKHWNEPGAASPAIRDATLSLDWFSFTRER
jgi:hypothetical protein